MYWFRKKDPVFAQQLRCLSALAFVPEHAVRTEYERVKRDPILLGGGMPMQRFLKYFEKTWIGRTVVDNQGNMTFLQPEYDIWNVYISVSDKLDLTNNAVEGYHVTMRRVLGNHPDIYKFLKGIIVLESLARLKMLRLRNRPPTASKRVYRELKARREDAVRMWEAYPDPRYYVQRLAHLIHHF